VVRADAILETVELGYGTSPSTTKFTIPEDPFNASDFPEMDDDVEVIVNGKSLFEGIIKNIESNITGRERKVSYIAYSNVILQTYNPVTWDYVLEVLADYNGLNITDQNQLQALETVANYLGNYRLYYNMQTDEVEQYQLGTGYYNRNIVIGKNIVEYNITQNTVNKVTKVTVRGDRKRTRVAWQPLSMYTRILDSVYFPGLTITYFVTQVDAFNISNIKVEAFQSLGQPSFEFDPEISLVPSDFGKTIWEDGTIGPKQKVNSYFNPSSDWRNCGAKVAYTYRTVGDKDIPVTALLELTSNPKIYKANTKAGFALREGRVSAEDINFGWCRYALSNEERFSPFRMTWEYEDELPTEVTVGSGIPAITLTDTSYKIFVNNAPEANEIVTNNTSEVITAMTARANAELEKLNRPTLSGRIKILGDETFDLKTLVNIQGENLDVVRVVHNFVGGFTTELELTNEKFRVNIPPFQSVQKTIYDKTLLTQALTRIDLLAIQLQQRIDTGYFEQDKNTITLTSPFSLYAD
jgi:hypothetical protein